MKVIPILLILVALVFSACSGVDRSGIITINNDTGTDYYIIISASSETVPGLVLTESDTIKPVPGGTSYSWTAEWQSGPAGVNQPLRVRAYTDSQGTGDTYMDENLDVVDGATTTYNLADYMS